jgi:hypothetical protein
MKKHTIRRVGSLMGGLFLMLATSNAQALLIDNFSDAQNLSRNTTGFINDTAVAPGALGGKRDARIDVTSSMFGNKMDLSVGAVQPNLSLSKGTGVSGSSTIEWDGGNGANNIDTLGLGGVDLTDGGLSDRFHVRVLEKDLASSLTFTIYDTAGGSASGSIGLPVPIAGTTDFYLLFSNLVGAVDLTHVGAIKMVISGVTNADLTLGSIETTHTPEPSTLLLLGTGLLSVAGYGWRRKKLPVQA